MIIDNTLGGLEKINEVVSRKGNTLYIMKGIFTEFLIKNRNERIYTPEKFLPHLSELLERKKLLKVVYGEFDHPDVFDTSLTRISHTIQNAWYVKENNRVDGEIRLTSTFYGKEARALVDDDLPIFVSSRAAGVTESNGEVTVKKLFTYDAVADPGFSSARMELKNMNESLGFNENVNFRIFDMSEESKINELFNMENNENRTQEKMEEFKEYLDEQLVKTEKSIEETLKTKNFDPEKLTRLYEEFESLSHGQKKMAEYLDHIADSINVLIEENKELKKTNEKLEIKVEKTKDRTKDLVKHNDYLAESLEKTMDYLGYVVESTDKVIDYQKYIAEKLDNGISFIEYVAENVDYTIKYSEYIAENYDKIVDYTEYVAENLDKNIAYTEYVAENLDNAIDYSEYIGENAEKIIDYTQYIAEHVDNAIRYTEYVGENVDNSIRYGEYVAEEVTDVMAYQKYNAEVLDRTIDYTKQIVEKLNSSEGLPLNEAIGEMDDMTTDDPTAYYDKPEETEEETEEPTNVEEPVETSDEETQDETQDEIQDEIQDETQDEEDIEGVNTEEIQDEEGEDSEMGIVPGMVVKIDDDKTGEVLATNDDNKIVVVKIGETGETEEIDESRLTIIGTGKIYESEEKLHTDVQNLILAAKERKASKVEDPHFLLFLNEKQKVNYFNLTPEDKERVNFAMNENKGKYTNAGEVLSIIQKAITKSTQSLGEMLVENIPSDLKPLWESLNPKVQEGILSGAQFYTNLTEDKVESFWVTRDLQDYASRTNASKKVLNENIDSYDNFKLSDEQLEAYKNILNRY